MDNFNKTVDLRENASKLLQKQLPKKEASKREDQILEPIFENTSQGSRKHQQEIRYPGKSSIPSVAFRVASFAALAIVIAVAAYSFGNRKDPAPQADQSKKQDAAVREEKWYAVKLADGEVFYGLIKDISADPLSIRNVYYNYDQVKDAKKEFSESGSIRLVKRGKETHGPTGEINLVRSQVLLFEPLSEDSNVLKAILQNEGK